MGNKNQPNYRGLVNQMRMMLEAILADPTMYDMKTRKITVHSAEKWQNLTEQINAFPTGITLDASSWETILGSWLVTSKDTMHRNRAGPSLLDPTDNSPESQELVALEKKLYCFLQMQESSQVSDDSHREVATYGEAGTSRDFRETFNVFSNYENDENSSPDDTNKEAIIMKEDDPDDPTGDTKRFKIIFDNNLIRDRFPTIRWENMEDMQDVSTNLAHQITSIQGRISRIKSLWKHRCGNN